MDSLMEVATFQRKQDLLKHKGAWKVVCLAWLHSMVRAKGMGLLDWPKMHYHDMQYSNRELYVVEEWEVFAQALHDFLVFC